MKTVEEKATVTRILQNGLDSGIISEDEYNAALSLTTWEAITPILNKAQGITPTTEEQILKLARSTNPLHRSDFTVDELEKLKSLAPEEYEMLR